MIFESHRPRPPLSDFVEFLWYCEVPALPAGLERVLPTGRLSLLINLWEDELRWYPGDDPSQRRRLAGAAVCGAYSEHFAIDGAEQRAIAGVEFHPGGAEPLVGVPASEVRAEHVSLDALWGREANLLREELLAASGPFAILRALEAALWRRAAGRLERDPMIDYALARLSAPDAAPSLGAVAAELGISVKQLNRRFTAYVGLAPKRYQRVDRFQRVLDHVEHGGAGRCLDWAELALACGYYDQAHFIRDFRAFSGLTPSAYVRQHRERNHVVVEDRDEAVRFVQSERDARW